MAGPDGNWKAYLVNALADDADLSAEQARAELDEAGIEAPAVEVIATTMALMARPGGSGEG